MFFPSFSVFVLVAIIGARGHSVSRQILEKISGPSDK